MTNVSQKFCNISSYFVFQVFQRLFTKPSLWRCRLMVLCEGASSSDNVQVLVLDCFSIISSIASSSTTEGLPDLGLSSRLVLSFLKHLNQFCATRSSTVPRLSTSHISYIIRSYNVFSSIFLASFFVSGSNW